MRIECTQGGGLGYFPGLNKAVTIDVDRLDLKCFSKISTEFKSL
jgi:hypothetical protein